MGWYLQLDNNGKETNIKRFFTDKQVEALQSIWKKTKRVRWIPTEAPNGIVSNGVKQVTVPPEKKKPTVSILDVHNVESENELKELLLKADTEAVKTAIKKKLVNVTSKNK